MKHIINGRIVYAGTTCGMCGERYVGEDHVCDPERAQSHSKYLDTIKQREGHQEWVEELYDN